MTVQVDFYVLGCTEVSDKYRYACRIANKAYSRGMKVFVHTEDEEQSRALDKMLWTFSQGSFVPHAVCGPHTRDPERYPVQVGCGAAEHACEDLLISLTREVPPDYARFARVAELIIDQAEDKASGRRRFRFYREHGVEPHTHTIAEA